MKYLKKIALVSDLSVNVAKIIILPRIKEKIDSNFFDALFARGPVAKGFGIELNVIHGAIYHDKKEFSEYETSPDNLYIYKDNLEQINYNYYKYPFVDDDKIFERIYEIIKPNSNWIILGDQATHYNKLKDLFEKYSQNIDNNLDGLIQEATKALNTIIIYNKKIKDILESYTGKNLYMHHGSREYYIDNTDNNIIDISELELSRVYYDFEKPKVDDRLQGMVWSHGLAAYSKEDEWKKHLANIINYPEMEISCSKYSQNIGPIGIYVTGNIIIASHKDIWSEKAKNLKRIWDPSDIKPLLTKNNISDQLHSHGEIVLTNTRIIGMWVRGRKIGPLQEDKDITSALLKDRDQLLETLKNYKDELKNTNTSVFDSDKFDEFTRYRGLLRGRLPALLAALDNNMEDEMDILTALSWIDDTLPIISRNKNFHWKYGDDVVRQLFVWYKKAKEIKKQLYDKRIREEQQLIIKEAEEISKANGWPLTYLTISYEDLRDMEDHIKEIKNKEI